MKTRGAQPWVMRHASGLRTVAKIAIVPLLLTGAYAYRALSAVDEWVFTVAPRGMEAIHEATTRHERRSQALEQQTAIINRQVERLRLMLRVVGGTPPDERELVQNVKVLAADLAAMEAASQGSEACIAVAARTLVDKLRAELETWRLLSSGEQTRWREGVMRMRGGEDLVTQQMDNCVAQDIADGKRVVAATDQQFASALSKYHWHRTMLIGAIVAVALCMAGVVFLPANSADDHDID